MNNNTITKEQQEFITYLKNKYKNLDENKLKQLKESGQLEKDAEEFRKSKSQSKAKKAAHGTKLDYIKTISHKCPEGQELYYFKVGGVVKCGCTGKKLMQEGGKTKESVVDKFKKTSKEVKEKKCGGKMKKHQIGGKIKVIC